MTIIGRNPVREALADPSVPVEKLLIRKGMAGGFVDAMRKACKQRSIPFQFVPAGKLNQMSRGGSHQGVVLVTAAVAYADLEEMLNEVATGPDQVRELKPRLLVLDGIEDPHNFGALLRSAVAFGFAGVIVPERGMAPLGAVAMKASAGTASRIDVARTSSLRSALLQLKERGYWVAGADGSGEAGVWAFDWDRPLALVMGSEGSGMRPSVKDTCDFTLSIPLTGPAESLNVSVAGGLLMALANHHQK
ncbi:MAG: 23S rRNA (guanosine(2251)-2'-O)-methyltransferase RlmB [Bacteroidota bacterium]